MLALGPHHVIGFAVLQLKYLTFEILFPALNDTRNACSHEKFFYLFVESINSNCSFVGFPCTSTELFDTGLCSDCSTGGCAVMGFHPDGQVGRSGSFYLRTNADYPICIRYSG